MKVSWYAGWSGRGEDEGIEGSELVEAGAVSWEERGMKVEKGAGRNRDRGAARTTEVCARRTEENGMREEAREIAGEVLPGSKRGRARIGVFIVVV